MRLFQGGEKMSSIYTYAISFSQNVCISRFAFLSEAQNKCFSCWPLSIRNVGVVLRVGWLVWLASSYTIHIWFLIPLMMAGFYVYVVVVKAQCRQQTCDYDWINNNNKNKTKTTTTTKYIYICVIYIFTGDLLSSMVRESELNSEDR